mgnify:CR=1 FL=1
MPVTLVASLDDSAKAAEMRALIEDIAPLIEAIAHRYAGRLMVFKIDTSSQQRQAGRFNIRGVPTLLFFKGGELIDQMVGAAPQEEIERLIGRVL